MRPLLLAGLVSGLWLASPPSLAWAQISPGPLSAPHAQLEGSSNCLVCHNPSRGVDPDRCLDCHQLLEARMRAGEGLHSRPEYAACATCHMEHSGREFQLIWWGDGRSQNSFDHALAGFVLAGAHTKRRCRDCHQKQNMSQPQALTEARKSLDRTFLGLDPQCDSCHVDPHRGQFGDRGCASCHTETAWKPASGFDHAATGFPLRQAHAVPTCDDCHRVEAAAPAVDDRGRALPPVRVLFRGADPQGCASCHTDEHRGQLAPAACSDCHSETAFVPATGFSHATADYALTGRHRQLKCGACHPTETGPARTDDGRFTRYRPLAFDNCSSCHTDVHEARLGSDCQSCHSTAGWDRRSQSFDHDRTRYPLRGRHSSLECVSCHTAGAPMRIESFTRCSDCHADQHLGQLSPRFEAAGCESCHSVEGFSPARFDIHDHDSTRYPLQGAHRTVDCRGCHLGRPVRDLQREGVLAAAAELIARDPAVITTQLRFARLDCDSCHLDPHAGQIDDLVRAGGCDTCHTSTAWNGVTFDHGRTDFPLAGSHTTVSCVQCHPRAETAPGGEPSAVLSFRATRTDCESCHTGPHRGQFSEPGRVRACTRCHTDRAWKPSIFDHAQSAFPLDGAHAEAACGACHVPVIDAAGSFVRYRSTPTDCRDCHLGAALETPL